jgi:hypothetical protein
MDLCYVLCPISNWAHPAGEGDGREGGPSKAGNMALIRMVGHRRYFKQLSVSSCELKEQEPEWFRHG